MTREPLPTRRESVTLKFTHRGIKNYGTVSFFEDGRLAENFLKCGKAGSAIEAMAHELAVGTSLAYQYGCPAAVMRAALPRLEDGSPEGPLGALLDKVVGEAKA